MSVVKNRKALAEWRERVQKIQESTAVENPFETKADKLARIEKAKKDYTYMMSYYFPHIGKSATPAFHKKAADKIKRNKKIKLWLKWGRGHAKSVVADITVPMWLWINQNIGFMVLIGENADKASILLEDLRVEFEGNQRLIHDFGKQRNHKQWEKGFFITNNGFICKSLGMGQSPRGLRVGPQRPDYIACDDWETRESKKNPRRQDEMAEWLLSDVLPTSDVGNRRVILAQNHFAPRMIFSKIVDENEAWQTHRVNAYDPATYKPTWSTKYTDDHFKEIEKEIGILSARAEYNNDPHVEGKVFKEEHIQWAKLPRLDHFEAIVGRWDVAYAGTPTSDFNAVRMWGLYKGKKYLIDCFVKRSKIRAALQWIAFKQKELPASVKVPFRFEAQFWNDEIYRIIEEVEKEFGITLYLMKAPASKVRKYDRMLEMLPQYENNRVYYNEQLKSHNDTKEGIAQLKGLEPNYKTNDDAPDADKEAFDDLDAFSRKSTAPYRIGKRVTRRY